MFPQARNLTRSAAALFGFALLLLPAPASAQTPVVFGDTISSPGIYFLAGNQTGGGDGIVIESDDVVLLLGRFTLRGDGTGDGIGSDGNDNVHIVGGRVTNFDFGVRIADGDNCSVQGTRMDHCGLVGLSTFEVSDSLFSRLRCDNNRGLGVEAAGTDDSRFISILAHDNDVNGISLVPSIKLAGLGVGEAAPFSERNKVKLCWAAYNGRDGIRLVRADDNEIQRNECVGNGFAGIRLAPSFAAPDLGDLPATRGNHVRSNWCVFNGDGIRLEEDTGDNTMTNNTALANSGHDMVDETDTPSCANTWFLNFFLTKDGDAASCIF